MENKMYTFAFCHFGKRKEEKGRGRDYRTFVCYEINTIPTHHECVCRYCNNNKRIYDKVL